MSTLARRAPVHYGQSPGGRWAALGVIAAIHLGALWALMQVDAVRQAVVNAAPIMVSFMAAPPKPVVEPPKPPPPKPKPKPQVIATVAETPAPMEAAPLPEPEPPPAPAAEPAPPAPVIPPNFVAAYLDNPSPVYPTNSKRLREQGRVLLRVRVTADGRAEKLEIEQSSGYSRLDRAAEEAVRLWKFVPARQGEEPVAAWVLVPIVFELKE